MRKPTRRRSKAPWKAIGHIRCSTEDQHLGPDAQRKALERWCQVNGAELVEVHEDLGVSGGAPLDKRPGLMDSIDAVKTHRADVLLVAKRDRLARDVMVSAMVERLVEKAGARVLSTDGTGNGEGPEAEMMRGIIDVFAQYERALIRSRTKAGLAVKRARSERIGGVRYGYQLTADGVHVAPNPTEQAILDRIIAMHRDGLSIRSIAATLNGDAVPARGSRWHSTTIARLLKRADVVELTEAA